MYTGVEIVSADTSYSNPESEDNRGDAFSVVELVGRSSTDNHVVMSGTLRDGTMYHSQFRRLHGGSMKVTDNVSDNDTFLLGRELNDGWWIKASNEQHFFLTRGDGRRVEYRTLTREDAAELVQAPPAPLR